MGNMKTAALGLAMLFVSAGAAQADATLTAPIDCPNCAEWNKPQQPFKVVGNTWYVGPAGLSALLITSPKGHILLDGALPQSAPLIAANIKALGFKVEDIKLILNSHAHWDHAGGIAALKKMSGADVAASEHGARVLRVGAIGRDDPQYDPKDDSRMPKVPTARGVKDGETLTVGPLKVTAHLTPGHTPGSTTWTWTSCENQRCVNVVYADSLTPVSADGFRFTGARAAAFRKTIDKVGALKCDVIVSTHPDFTDTFKKLAARTATGNPFIETDGCRNYAAESHKRLDERLATERGAAGASKGHDH